MAPGNVGSGGVEKPSALTWANSRVSPRSWAISVVPMFDDSARIWVAVRSSVGWDVESWKTSPSMTTEYGTLAGEVAGPIDTSFRAAENATSRSTGRGS